MTFLVPFDGSKLSKTALIRATQFNGVFEDETIKTITIIPRRNKQYARENGWIKSDEPYDHETVINNIKDSINALSDNVDISIQTVGKYSPSGTIANKIRSYARQNDVSIVFIGSENAGRLSSSFSVGATVSCEISYDALIVSQAKPAKIKELEQELSTEETIEEEKSLLNN